MLTKKDKLLERKVVRVTWPIF